MHRRPLLQLLERYAAAHPDEHAVTGRIRALVEAEPRCFERDSFAPGHITASCWIVDDDARVLLTHHRKLGRWLQLGGHADGDPDVFAVALREAREESGMDDFESVPALDAQGLFDLDVHRIPARGSDPAHEHHDLRFLLRARPGQVLVRSDESNDLRWFDADALAGLGLDESVWRLHRKAETWLASQRGAASA